MKRKVLFLIFIVFCGILYCEDKAVVIKEVKTDFYEYGIIPDVFNVEEITNITEETRNKLVSSLDNSLLLMFGEQVPVSVYKSIFSSIKIKESIKNMLGRGGIIYFGPTSWDILNATPSEMKDFFKEIGAYLITVSNYKGETTQAGSEQIFTGIANPDFPHPFTSFPNDLSKTTNSWSGEKSIRYFSGLEQLTSICKPLIIDKDKKVPLVIIQENILGKGRIINSYCYSTTREKTNPFIENIIVNLYGKRGKVSLKERRKTEDISKEGMNEKFKKAIYPVYTKEVPNIDGKKDKIWDNAYWVELMKRDGSTPEKKTKVGSLYDDNNIYFYFDIEEPNIDNLKADVLQRDGEVWNDDCVEIIIKVKKDVYHFIVNSKGVLYDEKNKNIYWNPEYKVGVDIKKGEKKWSVEVGIPMKIFETTYKDEPVWEVGLFREEQQIKELSSILPSEQGFLDPNCWVYFSFIPEEELKEYIKKGENKGRGGKTGEGYFLWYQNPYKEKTVENAWPDNGTDELNKIKVLVCQNEKECTNVLITNFTEDVLIFRVEPNIEGVSNAKGEKYLFSQFINLKQAIPRLNAYKEQRFDPIVKLDEGNLITIGSYQTAILWMDIKTDVPEGIYNTNIEFVPVNNLIKPKKVDIEIEVVSIKFPEKLPLIGYNFGPYDMAWAKGKRENYFKICPEYHLSLGHLYFPTGAIKKDEKGNIYVSKNKEDYFRKFLSEGKYIIEEKLAEKYFDGWIYSYGIYGEFNTRLKSLGIPEKKIGIAWYWIPDMEKEEWKKIFSEWASTWLGYLKEEGIDFKKFYIPLLDEPKDEIIDELFETGTILKSINPDVQLTINPATWSTLDVFKKLEPIIDLWIPWEARLTSPGRKNVEREIEFYQNTEKSFAPYLCSMYTQTLPLLSYYRFRGIREYLLKANGIALWSFNSWRGNDWNEFDDFGQGGDCMIFYHGDNGPIPSIRAESFREGFEDFYLLLIANEKFQKNKSEKLKELIDKEYLTKIMAENNPDSVLKWRESLIRSILEN